MSGARASLAANDSKTEVRRPVPIGQTRFHSTVGDGMVAASCSGVIVFIEASNSRVRC
jgi:hypothetical protein